MSDVYNENAPSFSGETNRSNLTAFFNSRVDADAAVKRLAAAGVRDVRLMPGYEADEETPSAHVDNASFWARLEDWLFPDEDRNVYAKGLRRGGFLVSAWVDSGDYAVAHDILDHNGAIDMDERADLWRAEGWSGRAQQAEGGRDDVFAADAAAGAAGGVGRYSRSADPTSPRIRAYELRSDVPADMVDDVLPTGHQRDVSEVEHSGEDDMSQSQQLDNLRQKQALPGSR